MTREEALEADLAKHPEKPSFRLEFFYWSMFLRVGRLSMLIGEQSSLSGNPLGISVVWRSRIQPRYHDGSRARYEKAGKEWMWFFGEGHPQQSPEPVNDD